MGLLQEQEKLQDTAYHKTYSESQCYLYEFYDRHEL